jgi:RimJ/RimL family protein N-acetyltransferase
MHIILETERLLLRTFTRDDAPLIYELNLDPDVTRYTGDPVRDLSHAREVLEQVILPQYTLYNHGRWAVLLKPEWPDPIKSAGMTLPELQPEGDFIGWCGLKTRPERNEIDLGFRFMKKAWGKGFATEAARACLEYGFGKLNLPRIVARAMPQNSASIRVIEKCGMQYIGDEVVDGHPAKTYEAIHPLIQP